LFHLPISPSRSPLGHKRPPVRYGVPAGFQPRVGGGKVLPLRRVRLSSQILVWQGALWRLRGVMSPRGCAQPENRRYTIGPLSGSAGLRNRILSGGSPEWLCRFHYSQCKLLFRKTLTPT